MVEAVEKGIDKSPHSDQGKGYLPKRKIKFCERAILVGIEAIVPRH
jgi:hypothetical protein